jgi:hypothetical protein
MRGAGFARVTCKGRPVGAGRTSGGVIRQLPSPTVFLLPLRFPKTASPSPASTSARVWVCLRRARREAPHPLDPTGRTQATSRAQGEATHRALRGGEPHRGRVGACTGPRRRAAARTSMVVPVLTGKPPPVLARRPTTRRQGVCTGRVGIPARPANDAPADDAPRT